jgi:hypothetical protein
MAGYRSCFFASPAPSGSLATLGERVRLEQERIAFSWVGRALRALEQ